MGFLHGLHFPTNWRLDVDTQTDSGSGFGQEHSLVGSGCFSGVSGDIIMSDYLSFQIED